MKGVIDGSCLPMRSGTMSPDRTRQALARLRDSIFKEQYERPKTQGNRMIGSVLSHTHAVKTHAHPSGEGHD